MYRAEKHYGAKTGEFKTILGYITDEPIPRLKDIIKNEYLPIYSKYVATRLCYFLIHKLSTEKDWEILRSFQI